MPKIAYKCCKCRKRHIFTKPIDEYKTRKMYHINQSGKRVQIYASKICHCGHARFYLDKERNARMLGVRPDPCYCEGYKHPHRKGVRMCIHHPNAELNHRVERYGEKKEDVEFDMAFVNGGRVMGVDEPCPF